MAGDNGSGSKAGVPISELRGKKIFTTGEAAQLCKVSQQTIIRCFDSGRLNGFRVPGSRFRRIPREELMRFMQTNGIPTEILEGGARRVLIVDDDPKILELFTDVLGDDERFDIKTAANGYDAGMMTEAFKPHLVVLDYMLPDVNGNIVCQRIREHDDLVDTKIIFVSGVVNQNEIQGLLDSGGDDFVKKPFDVPELIGKMTALLGLDHHTAAKRLSEHWGLPESLRDVMWLHAQPMSSVPELPHRNLIALVNTARSAVRELHLGFSGDFGPMPDSRTIAAECGLDPQRTAEALPDLPERVIDRCNLLGLEAPNTGEILVDAVAQANRALGRVVTALEGQARSARRQAGVLGAIEGFHSGLRRASTGRSVVGVLGEIVSSASGLLGSGFYATLFQTRPGEDWQLHRFGSGGELIQAQQIEPPPSPEGGRQDLASLTSAEELSVAAMAAMPWLADHMIEARDLRKVRFLPLTAPEPDRTGPAAVLVHDRDLAGRDLNNKRLAALMATWAAAIDSAHGHERSRDLGEQLADRNRALAETQQLLTEAESMARLGEMTAGAAHEMNNPLTVISGRSQVLALKLAGSDHEAAAQAVHDAAQDLSELITALHMIAMPPEPKLAAQQLREMIAESAKATELRVGLGVRINLENTAEWGAALADRELLVQAVIELMVNAAEADPAGPVTVRAEPLGGGGRVAIEITDSGPGMSTKALKHAFDPFFSEKPAGRQRGLGLPKAKRLIELQGGSIALIPMTGGGTLARVVLPSAKLEASTGTDSDSTQDQDTPSTSRGAAA